MEKEVFRIIRVYRKSFVMLATKYPNEALDYWFIYYHKTEGVIALLATDYSISIQRHMLIYKYLNNQWERLYNIYCK